MSHKILSLDVLEIRYPKVRLGMAGSDLRLVAPNPAYRNQPGKSATMPDGR